MLFAIEEAAALSEFRKNLYNGAMTHFDPDKINMPAYLRRKALVKQSKQKLILTALDRKEAHLPPKSTRALAPLKTPRKTSSKLSRQHEDNISNHRLSRDASLRSQTPRMFSRPVPRTSSPREPATRDFLKPPQPTLTPSSEPAQISFFHEAPRGPQLPPNLAILGTVTHYLPKIDVAILKLTSSLAVGDFIYLPCDEGLFLQQVEEIQIDRNPVLRAMPGDHIGLKVSRPVSVEGKGYKG